MRRITVCLLLLLAPFAALASGQLANGNHESCVRTNSAARSRAPAPEAATARNSAHKPAPSTGGGGSESDSLFPRMRMMPHWHSFLPGMFR
ncbi:hypothetical protein [Xanthomonas fragariae]|uniref:Secreted protein n=1 Tax=Xanthomonas fragariae TaxID=48664 RepID=A0ABY1RUL3_9XANT|nr:hypothetical protein [Xanthomonas fragariae]SMR00968.1 hypothetical protein PD885_03748 [Xanthomonas fragariae]